MTKPRVRQPGARFVAKVSVFSFLWNFQIGCGAHSAPYSMDTGVLSRKLRGRFVKMTTHLQIVSKLRMSGVYLYSPYMPSWRGQGKFYNSVLILVAEWSQMNTFSKRFATGIKVSNTYQLLDIRLCFSVVSCVAIGSTVRQFPLQICKRNAVSESTAFIRKGQKTSFVKITAGNGSTRWQIPRFF